MADIYSCVTTAIGTLKGPLHGGANERVFDMLTEIREMGDTKAYLKENGFIGFLGYDSDSNQLIISTKSTIDGEHNDYFHRIIDELLTPIKKEKLKHVN